MNMILGDVEETVTVTEIDDETYEEKLKVRCCMPCTTPFLFPFFAGLALSASPRGLGGRRAAPRRA